MRSKACGTVAVEANVLGTAARVCLTVMGMITAMLVAVPAAQALPLFQDIRTGDVSPLILVKADKAKATDESRRTLDTYDRLNKNTTTVMADDPEGTLMRLAYDMARVLDSGSDLRVLPIVGKGAHQNVTDLLHLKGIDVALTQADVLADLKRSGKLGEGLESRVAYIAKICNLEVHIVARGDISTIAELEGQPVNFGAPGSGGQFTAQAIFSRLGVKPIEVNEAVEDARLNLERGRIAAYVVVDGKPSRLVSHKPPAGAKLLSIPYPTSLETDYLPATLTSNDYPDLVQDGAVVDTVAVGAVLAVYDWPAAHERHQRVGRLVNLFFSAFEDFQKPSRHAKWKETNLAAPLPGWKRFKPAQDWLDLRQSKPEGWSGNAASNVDAGRARRLAEKVAPGNAEEQKRLYELFMGSAAATK